MRAPDPQRGFILLGVIMIVAVVSATVALSMRQSAEALQQSAGLRASELTSASLSHGLEVALVQLHQTDPASLLAGDPSWDIFDEANTTAGWIPAPLQYPPVVGAGARANHEQEVTVRVGLRLGQKTQAPPGEDASKTYGYVVELQLSAETRGFGQAAEEQVAVGIQVPQVNSYAK